MKEKGYAPTRQNVSINVRVNSYSVDLVPGKRQNSYGDDHSLYRRKADTWTKTNVVTHINHVTRAAGGATGSPFQIPRIMGLAESDGLRGRREPKLRRIRLAKDHQPSLLVTLD